LGYILGDFFTNSSGHPALENERDCTIDILVNLDGEQNEMVGEILCVYYISM
jgi:hypothetical protein